MPEHFVDPAMDMISKIMVKRDKLQATADRLRGLLVEIEERISKKGWCPFCGNMAYYDGYVHFDDCRLAEELDNTTLGSRKDE